MRADRTFAIHYARIMLHECAARRRSFVNRNFYWLLFAGAQRARREAASPALNCWAATRPETT